jgi:Fe-S-cluster-containing dehydrogenase component
MPLDINSDNLTVIHLAKADNGQWTFVKKQCLHCNDPSCVSVCPVDAFTKRDDGVVSYDKDKCIGCRYCQVACPFDAPTFEYDEALPVIRKCDFCKDIRLAKGKEPFCADACPRGAIKFGKRGELLKEAKQRIKNNPDRYNDHVYGETEIGGTSVLVLAPKGIDFEKDLGYKDYPETPPFELQEEIQHGIFKYWIPPVALYGVLGLVALNNRKKANQTDEEAENES